jgi:hypothetical protein
LSNSRVAVTNGAGSVPLSSNATLTILPATASAVQTLAASGVTPFGAALNASANPMGARTTAWFEYGLTSSYGTRTSATNVGNASTVIPFAQAITGLMPNTNYHFRVVATNYGGVVLGADLTFQTSPPPLRLGGFALLGNGQFRLQFDGAAGTTYTMLASTNLMDWTRSAQPAKPRPADSNSPTTRRVMRSGFINCEHLNNFLVKILTTDFTDGFRMLRLSVPVKSVVVPSWLRLCRTGPSVVNF